MTSFTETLHAAGFLVSDAPGTLSREKITVVSGQVLLAGQVLGVISDSTGAPVYAATGGNTGNFTCGTVTESGPLVGVFKIEFIAATVFNVSDPKGAFVGEGHTGVAFSGGGLGFTITAGGTPAVAGDSATITVAANANAGKYAAFDPTATDGTQNAAAILFNDRNTSSTGTNADASATGIFRDCEVNKSELVWGANVTTDPQKAAALVQLAANHVIAR
jgi:hypothetical protein